MAPRVNFDTELELLNGDLIRMGSLAQEAIEKSIQALFTHDHTLAEEIIKDDKIVDNLEKMIESRCLHLLMRQQPVAKDLRVISTSLKVITDLERIADQAADIADLSLRFNDATEMDIAKHIPQMGKLAMNMVQNCVVAYIQNDLELARATMDSDDEVDALFDVVKHELIDTLSNRKDMADQAIDMMMVAKYLERIGDHAVNVCEWVIFYATGQHKDTQIL